MGPHTIRYIDVNGDLIKEEPMFFTRLYAMRQAITMDGIDYRVEDVSVVGFIQIVTISRGA